MRYQIKFFYLSASLILNRGNGFNKHPWLLLPFFSLLSHFSVLFMVMRPFFSSFYPQGPLQHFLPLQQFQKRCTNILFKFLSKKYFLVEKKRFYEVSYCTCLTSSELCFKGSSSKFPDCPSFSFSPSFILVH